MAEEKHGELLERIDKKLSALWDAIDEIRENMNRIELRQTEKRAEFELRLTQKITRLEAQFATYKWLLGLIVTQILVLAFWVMRK